jgi:hypothetical protein
MGFVIQDGTGKGFNAGIDSTNRILTRTVNETIFESSAEEGEAYFIGTPLITLTNAAASGIFLITNTEDYDIIFHNFFFVAESTNATVQMFRASWYKDATALSSPTAIVPLNQNFGSSKTLSVTAVSGVQGSTFTGGSLVAQLSFPIGQFNEFEAELVLPKGSTLGIAITPPTGNTSMPVQFGARSYRYIKTY